MSVLIRQAKIVDPQSDFHNKVVDILIQDGVIEAIGDGIEQEGASVISGDELCISQGFVDVFADYCEPGLEHKETIASGLNAAAAGGYTDVMLAPNTHPPVSGKSAVQFVLQKARGNAVRLHPLGSITQSLEGKALAEMLDMHHHGALAFTDGWKPVQHAGLFLKALEYVKSFEGILLQIPLDLPLSVGGLMHEGSISTRLGMAGIPELAETTLLHRDIELLRYTDSRLHITGLSTAAGVNLVRDAKKSGLDISCSVTPYHLVLTDEALKGYDSAYKVMPVLRTETDRRALIEGLQDGTIDCIATHHRPQDWDAKTKEFEYAADGMNLQEIAFSVVYDALAGKVSTERLVDAFSLNARKIFGLQTTPVAKGAGSFTIFSTATETEVNPKKWKSLSANHPYNGKKLKGSIVAIASNGQFITNQ